MDCYGSFLAVIVSEQEQYLLDKIVHINDKMMHGQADFTGVIMLAKFVIFN